MSFRVTPNRRYVDRFPAEILDRLDQIWERLAYFNEDQTGLLGPTGEPVELGASLNDLATAETGDFVALGVESDGAGSSDGILRDSAGVSLDTLSAVVAHRTGNLANLLALDGVPGEISVATDADALVVHNGVAGEAVDFRRDGARVDWVMAHTTGADNSGVSGAIEVLKFDQFSDVGNAALVDLNAYTFLVPQGAEVLKLLLMGKIYPYPSGTIPAVGDLWSLALELETGVGTGIYTEQTYYGGWAHVVPVANEAANTFYFSWPLVMNGLGSFAGRKFRIIMKNTGAVGYRIYRERILVEFFR